MASTRLAAGIWLALMCICASWGCGSDEKPPPVPPPEQAQQEPSELYTRLATPPVIPDPIYWIGPGDVLELRIYELEKLGEFSVLELVVDKEGRIIVPHVGPVKVVDRPIDEVRQAVQKALEDGYLQRPQVAARVKEHRSRAVQVLGSVSEPGIHHLETNYTTVHGAVARAGGVTEEASLMVRIYQEVEGEAAPSVVDVDLRSLLREEGAAQDLLVYPGSTLVVFEAGTFYVSGFVKRAGLFRLKKDTTVLKAIAVAGSLIPRQASPSEAVIQRTLKSGEVIYIPVDLEEVAEGEATDVALVAGDHVIVPQTTLRAVLLETWDVLKGRIAGLAVPVD